MDEHDFNSLKSRVAELEERLDFLYKHFGVQFSNQPAWADPRIKDLVLRGDKIEAIKLYRELTNTGLAEAKAVIDRLEANL